MAVRGVSVGGGGCDQVHLIVSPQLRESPDSNHAKDFRECQSFF